MSNGLNNKPQPALSLSKGRVMVIGVDGATLDLIEPWVKAGLLPNFARLMQEGSWGNLISIVPPMTPTAWSSFATGTNPGKHGLYDFVGRREGSYSTWLTNASHRKGNSIWKLLGQAGYQVTVFNVPVTYPIDKVNGQFVSGLLTPAGATDASWPPELLGQLKRAVPEFNFSPPGVFSPGEELDFVQQITDLNRTTLKTAKVLLGNKPWDFYMAVFMGVDIIGHFMWKQMVDGQRSGYQPKSQTEATLAKAIQTCYQQIDQAMGELMQAAGPDDYVVVMSDHGFGSLDRYIHVNTWLMKRGYLKFKNTPLTLLKRVMYALGITPITVYQMLRALRLGERMRRTGRGGNSNQRAQALIKKAFLSFDDVDWSRTRLYSFGFAGPIYVNQQGREPKGIVPPGAESEALLAQVTQDLKALRDPTTGEPLIGDIYGRGQLYWGARANQAPDLLFMPRDMKNAGFGLLEFGSNDWFTTVADRTGTHRMSGIVLLKGPGILQGAHLSDSSIMDIAPTVLALMGQPIPDIMDGSVLEKAMTPELRASLRITRASAPAAGTPPLSDDDTSTDIDAAEEEIIRARLRDLGYVA